MAVTRRGQALGLVLGLVIVYFLFFSGSDTTDFRRTTEASLSSRRGVLRGHLSDADLTARTNQELQEILDKQKSMFDPTPVQGDKQNSKSWASSISFDDDEDVSVAGRVSMPKSKEKPKYPVDGSGVTDAESVEGEEVAVNKAQKAAEEGQDLAREELQGILKKSPIIIFSKSYCPYSKRAKALLLETYTISPAPYVVELDLMTTTVPNDDADEERPAPTLGRKLQDLLASLTGRRTVPNIMINAQSLGGSDDIARMHAEGTLEEEIKKLGGKRIVSIEKAHKGEK